MTRAPTERFAIHFDMASEMNEPVKPTTKDMTSKLLMLCPVTAWVVFTPRIDNTNEMTNMTAMLVRMKRKIRFMCVPFVVKLGMAWVFAQTHRACFKRRFAFDVLVSPKW